MTSRIHIIGGPGSGKSTLAKKLSDSLGVASHDLDDLFWDNSAESYGTRETIKGIAALLRWNHGYDGDNLKRALSALHVHKDKLLVSRNAEDAYQMIIERRSQPHASLQAEGTEQ